MSSYLARLKQLESEKNLLYTPNTEPAKPSKGAFGGFAGLMLGVFRKFSLLSSCFNLSRYPLMLPP